MMPLKTCCLCCSLETGAYVLSGFGLFASLLTIILSSLMIERVIEAHIAEDILILRLIACIVAIFLYVLLIIGTKKRNTCMILPYLIMAFIGIIMQIVLFILVIASTLEVSSERMMGFYIGYPIGIAIASYIWMCMLSLYMKIKNDNCSNKFYTQHTTDSIESGKKYII